uniref:ORF8 protein n=1 Tax=Psittacine aviadenovirus B TaxID=2169709 RepID=A0AB38ZPB8_9ADEN
MVSYRKKPPHPQPKREYRDCREGGPSCNVGSWCTGEGEGNRYVRSL